MVCENRALLPWMTSHELSYPNSHGVHQRITHSFYDIPHQCQHIFGVGTQLRSWWHTPSK